MALCMLIVEHTSGKYIFGKIKNAVDMLEQIIHNNDPGGAFLKQTQWNKVR